MGATLAIVLAFGAIAITNLGFWWSLLLALAIGLIYMAVTHND